MKIIINKSFKHETLLELTLKTVLNMKHSQNYHKKDSKYKIFIELSLKTALNINEFLYNLLYIRFNISINLKKNCLKDLFKINF